MANMEFLKANILNTSTMVSAAGDSNTSTWVQLFDRLPSKKFSTSGYTGVTTTTLRFDFAATVNVSRIAVQKHNLRQFRLYYNGLTASTFALTGTPDTTSSIWSTNSATSHYLIFNTVAVTSLSIQMDNTIAGTEEKQIGELWISDLSLRLDNNPPRGGYDPQIFNKQIVHEMSDGGTAVYDIRDKFRATFKMQFRNDSITTAFRTIYDAKLPFLFAPFPTGTAWNGDLYETVWVGPFDAIRPTVNYWREGMDVEFQVRETPN